MKDRKGRHAVKPKHISSGNVLDDLGFSPEKAAVLKLRSELHSEILKAVDERGLTPRQLERVFNEPQPRISELLNGRISKMSVDKLTAYLFLLGKKVKIATSPRALTVQDKERLVA